MGLRAQRVSEKVTHGDISNLCGRDRTWNFAKNTYDESGSIPSALHVQHLGGTRRARRGSIRYPPVAARSIEIVDQNGAPIVEASIDLVRCWLFLRFGHTFLDVAAN